MDIEQAKTLVSGMNISERLDLSRQTRHMRGDLPQRLMELYNKKPEVYLCNMAQKFYGGQREICIPRVGRIDLLTRILGQDFMIEAKKYKAWKAAIGQILSYNATYNRGNHGYTPAIALIDLPRFPPDELTIILNRYGVSLFELTRQGELKRIL